MLMKIPEGTVILREGEKNMDMYKSVTGNVEVYSGYGTEKETILSIKSKGDFFGEMGLFTDGKPAIYTVVAYSDVLINRITAADIDEFILNNHVDVYRIMKNMAESMYKLKYSMDLYVEDLMNKENNVKLKDFSGFFSKQFAKYNATGMLDPMKNRRYDVKI